VIYISENIGKPDPETIERIQREIRHLEKVQVINGGEAGEKVNKGRREKAKGMRNVLREIGKKK
jgi:hypothetical protein